MVKLCLFSSLKLVLIKLILFSVCLSAIFNGETYEVGDTFPDPEDPICSNLTVVRKSPTKCPETIKETKDCIPQSCSSCETEILDGYDQCCGKTYRCEPKTCPENETCSSNDVQTKTTTECCTTEQCSCSCTGVGTPFLKAFHCNNTYPFEGGNCSYVVMKIMDSDDFNITINAGSCADMYPDLISPPVSCIKMLQLFYKEKTFVINVEQNKVYVSGTLITSDYNQDVQITFAQNMESVSMRVEEFGLHILYYSRNQGEFDIFLKKSHSSSGTTGICGQCSTSDDEITDCQANPVNMTLQLVDEACAPICDKSNCHDLQCVNRDECITNPCWKCADTENGNPCDALLLPIFSDCFENVDQEYETCNSSNCYTDESTANDQCSRCNSITLRKSIDKCPSCTNFYELLGCEPEATAAPNISCPENQIVMECEDSCKSLASCDDETTQDCGVSFLSSCQCPEGYVKESATSDKCIKSECCRCEDGDCIGFPGNFQRNVIGKDECGCDVFSEACSCTDDCANPEFPSQVIDAGQFVIDSTNSCITYRCPSVSSELCNTAIKEEESCSPVNDCPDERYEKQLDPDTANDCCPKYDCVCLSAIFNGETYEVGDTFPDPEDPICSNLTVVRKSPTKCPETIKETKDCIPQSCSSCETEILDGYDQCCGKTYRCEPKTCPENETCSSNDVQTKTTTECCTTEQCSCSCTGVGTPFLKAFHCNNTYPFEGGNCSYVVMKIMDSDDFNITINAGSCADMYPDLISPPVSCIKMLQLFYKEKTFVINVEQNKVYVSGTLITSDYNQDVQITFAQNMESVSMRVEEFGLHILYYSRNQGEFDIFLKKSHSSSGTTGICGQCSTSDDEITDCQANPVNMTLQLVDEACAPICDKSNCHDLQCVNRDECITNPCWKCADTENGNPCDALLLPIFSDCFENVDQEYETCNSSNCYTDESTANDQCSRCNSITLRKSIDKCPSCTNFYELLGCEPEATAAPNISCPENQIVMECEDSCKSLASCDDETTQDCGVSFLSSCQCPEGYVKEFATSDKCIKSECCRCEDGDCTGFPGNFQRNVIGKDECGCDVFSEACSCTDDCANPEFPSQVIDAGQFVIDSTNSCITYRCPSVSSELCNTAIKEEESCSPVNDCPDERYEKQLDPDTANDCCPKYDCVCVSAIFNGETYEVGDTFPDPEDPICSNLTVVRKSPTKCPETIKETKDCIPQSCSSCETEILDGYDQCCGNTYRCEPKTCPENETCSSNEVQTKTTTECCTTEQCSCSCTGVGTPFLKAFHCNNTYPFEGGNCSYVVMKIMDSDDFNITINAGSCADMYPDLISPPVSCIKMLQLFYKEKTFVINVEQNKVYVSGTLITSDYNQDVQITFAQNMESVSMRVEEFGLHILYYSRNQGEFDIFLKKSHSSSGTTGICGQCSTSDDEITNCQANPVNMTLQLVDEACAPICDKSNCHDLQCVNRDECITNPCWKCADTENGNPCDALLLPIFSDCFENVDQEYKTCNSSNCYTDESTANDQCSRCNSLTLRKSIDKCPSCTNFYELLGCEPEATAAPNISCPENQIVMECEDSCKSLASCDVETTQVSEIFL
ncbi:uncharacterized protein LOC144425074 [Styela clava]